MSYQYMSDRLVEMIQELRDYLGPETYGFSEKAVVHKVKCKALGIPATIEQAAKG
jgi:hypothetical protein